MINNKKRSIFRGLSVTVYIILINIVLSLIGFLLIGLFCSSQFGECNIIDYFALKPANIIHGDYLWTLITHMFFHGNIFHLLINMLALFSLGSLCERIVGRKRYVWFYLIAGIFAGLLSVVLAALYGEGFASRLVGTVDLYMVGASGAIFGIAGLFVTLIPKMRFSIIFLPFFSLPGYIMVPLVLFLTWLASFFAELPIGNVAHLGGFLVGIVYGMYLRKKYKRKIKMLDRIFK